MYNYDRRMQEAWEKVPQHRQKDILEELERKAYRQDFTSNDRSKSRASSSDENILEPVVDFLMSWISDSIDGAVILYKHFFKK